MHIDDMDIPDPPPSWTMDWVMYLTVLGAQIFSRLRDRVGPKGYGSAWVQYTYTEEDKLWQKQTTGAGEMSEFEKSKTLTDVVIYVPPDPDELELATTVSTWPARYLGVTGEKVCAITRWAGRRAHGGDGDIGIAMVEAEALKIADGLRRDCIPVRDVPSALRAKRNQIDAPFEDDIRW